MDGVDVEQLRINWVWKPSEGLEKFTDAGRDMMSSVCFKA
jgi:hypothetical protein